LILEKILESTNEYILQIPKSERKHIGQFFTSKNTAMYMASLFKIPMNKTELSILDAGAGTGILACVLIERLVQENYTGKINLDCYETDENTLVSLRNNLKFLKASIPNDFSFYVFDTNYITSQALDFNNLLGRNPDLRKYDMIIGNPPYKKISKDAPEAIAMPSVCYGAPNLYFLFTAMNIFHLAPSGELVVIIPRSWTSGAYFERFRHYLLSNSVIERIHLFSSRDKVFDTERILQETVILKAIKTDAVPSTMTISASASSTDFHKQDVLTLPYDTAVTSNERYIFLPTNDYELEVVTRIRRFPQTLLSLGLRMKTGLTVDFRCEALLSDKPETGTVPLFYSQHIQSGYVQFPISKDKEYIRTQKAGFLQKNKNYLFIKRFTAKEEMRRLQCGIYLANNYPKYREISTQNKINFIDKADGEMSDELVYGLYALFNSKLYDTYYRIMNGSTQVNSSEFNTIPIPDIDTITAIGHKLLIKGDLSEESCDQILEVLL